MHPHFQKLLELLKIEQAEDLRLYEDNVLKSPLQERKAKGFCWYPVRLAHTEFGMADTLFVTVERQSTEPHVFAVGSMVSVFANQGDKPTDRPSVTGVIAAIQQQTMRVALHAEEFPDWIDEGKLGVDVLFDNLTYREMEKAVKLVGEAPPNTRIGQLRSILLAESPPAFKALPYPIEIPALNESQQQAVRQVLACQDVSIIHGPPGTGKTTTLVKAIELTLKLQNHAKPVLVTAPSNAAVDLLTLKLAQKGLAVMRIGNPARIAEELQDYTLESLMAGHFRFKELKQYRKEAEKLLGQANKFKRNFGAEQRAERKLLQEQARQLRKEANDLERFIVQDTLQKARVITATLVGSANELLAKTTFGAVFIDEAAQALEPACWIATLKAEKIILAGDHCQLPPTVKAIEADRKGLSKTLFENSLQLHQKQGTPLDTMLQTQYRMNTQIMQFSNQEFYKNQLQADQTVKEWCLDEMPLEFIDTAGCSFDEQIHKQTGSIQNPSEAQLLVQHLQTFLSNLPNPNISIGIISPYKAQVQLIANLLKEAQLSSQVEANTVDSFQGQERDCIYISLVRSNDTGEIGFLKDTRRLNVALTRAKKKLVVIGDSATLANHPFYANFLGYAEQQNAYRSAWELI